MGPGLFAHRRRAGHPRDTPPRRGCFGEGPPPARRDHRRRRPVQHRVSPRRTLDRAGVVRGARIRIVVVDVRARTRAAPIQAQARDQPARSGGGRRRPPRRDGAAHRPQACGQSPHASGHDRGRLAASAGELHLRIEQRLQRAGRVVRREFGLRQRHRSVPPLLGEERTTRRAVVRQPRHGGPHRIQRGRV